MPGHGTPRQAFQRPAADRYRNQPATTTRCLPQLGTEGERGASRQSRHGRHIAEYLPCELHSLFDCLRADRPVMAAERAFKDIATKLANSCLRRVSGSLLGAKARASGCWLPGGEQGDDRVGVRSQPGRPAGWRDTDYRLAMPARI
jgi:hypothetical protein